MVLLAVVLAQQAELQPTQIVTDTDAYGDGVFGVFRLLVYHFYPRLADVGGTRFWHTRPDAVYGKLNGLARQTVKFELITERPVRNPDAGYEVDQDTVLKKNFMGIDSVGVQFLENNHLTFRLTGSENECMSMQENAIQPINGCSAIISGLCPKSRKSLFSMMSI